jgi:hypothetical protein
VDLDKLQYVRSSELFIREQRLQFRLGSDRERFGALGRAAEDVDDIFILPLRDIVVLGVEAVDVALDGVAFVAEDEAGEC